MERGRFTGGGGEATDAEYEERKFIASKAKKQSFINLDEGSAIDSQDNLLLGNHKRYSVHHSAPRRHKGIKPQRSILSEEGSSWYGDDIHLSKEKYNTNSTNQGKKPPYEQLPQ